MKNNMKKVIRMAFALILTELIIPKPVLAASVKISSAEDLLAMEENPSGDYILTKDITVPKNTNLFASTPFTGTLDGKGHKLKGYKSTSPPAIFANAKYAQFKNLTVSNVDIKVGGNAAALVGVSTGCEFKNVSVTGKIVSTMGEGSAGGLVSAGTGSMEKCRNSAKITAEADGEGKYAGGLAGKLKRSF